MHQSPQADAQSEFEAETGDGAGATINDLIRRLAAAIDDAVDSKRDSRALVAEALMRLALGVHLYAAGPHATRERLLAMALRTGADASVN
jgi:hypothetical protein